MRQSNSSERHLPAIATSLAILVAVLATSLIFAINSRQPLQHSGQPQQQKVRPAIGDRIQAAIDGIPAVISREHVVIIRKQLARSTPAGKWEEIEWRSEELDPYEDVEWEMPGMNDPGDPAPRNAAEAAARFGMRRAQAFDKGLPLPEPQSFKVQIPKGTQTTLRLRTQNPLGGMTVFEVSIQQRENDFSYKGLTSDFYSDITVDSATTD